MEEIVSLAWVQAHNCGKENDFRFGCMALDAVVILLRDSCGLGFVCLWIRRWIVRRHSPRERRVYKYGRYSWYIDVWMYANLRDLIPPPIRDKTEKNGCQRKGMNRDQSFQGLLCQKMYISWKNTFAYNPLPQHTEICPEKNKQFLSMILLLETMWCSS